MKIKFSYSKILNSFRIQETNSFLFINRHGNLFNSIWINAKMEYSSLNYQNKTDMNSYSFFNYNLYRNNKYISSKISKMENSSSIVNQLVNFSK